MENREKINLGKDKMVIKTLHANILGLEKGSWLYYNPESDLYEFTLTKDFSHRDIGYYYSYTCVRVNIDRLTVEPLIGDIFEYVTEPFIIEEKKEDTADSKQLEIVK